MERHIIPAETLRQFVFGGHATLTVESVTTGNYFTYRLKHFYKTEDGKRVLDRNSNIKVWVLSGPNNETSYQYIGTINIRTYTFNPVNAGTDATSVGVISRLVALVRADQFPTQVRVYHNGTCGVCGRKLTTPSSIVSGIGPTCSKINPRRRVGVI
jgi:hypothetical protein